jgi:hypothetical protein
MIARTALVFHLRHGVYSARFSVVSAVQNPSVVMQVNSTASDAALSTIPAKAAWPVEVTFRKRAVQSRWADFQWEPASVAQSDAVGELSCDVLQVNGETQWRWVGPAMDLHPSEGEGYWLNLTSDVPCLFVMWRMEEGEEIPRPVVVTASYNEAGRMLDAGDRVDRVPMPEAMQAALAEYTMKFYQPEVRKKVKRNDPFRNQNSEGRGQTGEAAGTANELIVPANSPAARGLDRG